MMNRHARACVWMLFVCVLGCVSCVRAVEDAEPMDYGFSRGRIPLTYAKLINEALKNRDEAAAYINWANGYFLDDDSPLPKCLAGKLCDQDGREVAPFYQSRPGCPHLMYAYFQFYKSYPSDPLAQDCLKRCVAFADTMIAHGTDRYGTVTSPLLSGILTRDPTPRVPENPKKSGAGLEIRFLPGGKAGRGFYVMDFGNIWYGGEESHKSSWHGANIAQDEYLYLLLYDMAKTLKKPGYKRAADKSLSWFMANCPGESGLLPMGEHAGWNFFTEQYDRGFYHARLHEDAGGEHLYDKLIELQPRERPGETTAMERFALAIFPTHINVATAGAGREGMLLYCRHGPLYSDRVAAGSADDLEKFGGFPRVAGAWLRVWGQVYNRSANASVRARIAKYMNRMIDGLYEQRAALKVDYFPYANWDIKGNARNPHNSQNDKLAQGAREAAYLAQDDRALCDRLLKLAKDANHPGGAISLPAFPGPPPATQPTPADNAVGVPQRLTLRWTRASGAIEHCVYVATDPGAIRIADEESDCCRGRSQAIPVSPGELAANTTYYWAVDEIGSDGVTKGPIWCFTTGGTGP